MGKIGDKMNDENNEFAFGCSVASVIIFLMVMFLAFPLLMNGICNALGYTEYYGIVGCTMVCPVQQSGATITEKIVHVRFEEMSSIDAGELCK